MNNVWDMVWVELRKAIRSGIPLWTGLGSLFLPLGVAFLVFVARNPEISKQLGLVSAKADLLAYSATDWSAYLSLFGQLMAAAGFILFVLIVSWVFGREFVDDTLKDMLAVPVGRGSILLAKFFVAAVWSAGLAVLILLAGLIIGAMLNLPGGSAAELLQGINLVLFTSGMVIVVGLPFAFFASAGRGYLLPMGLAMLTLILANLAAVAGWGDYFPWTVPGLYAQGQGPLASASYWLVLITGLVGILATYGWWKYADQA